MKRFFLGIVLIGFTFQSLAQSDTLKEFDKPKLTINLPFTSLLNPLFPSFTIGATYYVNPKFSAELDVSLGLGSWRLIDSLEAFPTNDFRVLYHLRSHFPNGYSYLSVTSGYIRNQGKREHFLPVNYQGINEAFMYKTHEDYTRNIFPLLFNVGVLDEMNNDSFIGFDVNVGFGVYFVFTQSELNNPNQYDLGSINYRGTFQDPNRNVWPWINYRMAFKINALRR